MIIKLRIENDKDITNLLKKHKKYYLEYQLNISAQGYDYLINKQFYNALFFVAVSELMLNSISKSLRRADLI